MNEMIERCAKAIADKLESIVVEAVRNAGEGSGPYPSDYRDAARAVIEAMREPTEAMLLAGGNALVHPDDLDHEAWNIQAENCWQAMIDKALAGDQP